MATSKQLTTKQKTTPQTKSAKKPSAKPQAATKKPAATAKTKASSGGAKKPRTKQAEGQLSALDAAAKVLAETGKALTSKEMIEAMSAKNYWKSPGGKTPAATLYSGILREITTKGKESRFQKIERGKFAAKK